MNESRKAPASALNPANLLTLLRIVLAPALAVFLLERQWQAAFFVFCAAALTDFWDGWLARRLDAVTPLGKFIDPLADKALQLTAFSILALRGVCPTWVAVLAWARELLVVTGFSLLALVVQVRGVQVSRLGRAGAFSQMTALALVLAVQAFPAARDPRLAPTVLWILALAVLVNFAAGLEYAYQGLKVYGDSPMG